MTITAVPTRRWLHPPPALWLFLLAPLSSEFLSGSTPFILAINPLVLLIFAAHYGSGAVLARELTQRWNRGWPTLLGLGLAYGVINEGLTAKTFFTSDHHLSPLIGLGRIGDVNSVWAVTIPMFHACMAVAAPVALISLARGLPTSFHGAPWIKDRTMVFLTMLLGLSTIALRQAIPVRPSAVGYLFAVVAVVALIVAAHRLPWPLPPRLRRNPAEAPRGPATKRLAAVGFAGMGAYFLAGWAVPAWGSAPFLLLVVVLCIPIAAGSIVRRISGFELGPDSLFWLVAGAYSWWILLACVAQIALIPGQGLGAVFFAVLLIWTRRRMIAARSRDLASLEVLSPVGVRSDSSATHAPSPVPGPTPGAQRDARLHGQA